MRTWVMLGAAFIIQIAVLVVWWLVCRGNKAATGNYVLNNGCTFDTDQYADMAKSLLNGHVYMDLPVNKNLAAMHNPYDVGLRCSPQILNNGDKTPVFFDMAFYQGKYYQYFGVLPVIPVHSSYCGVFAYGYSDCTLN